MRALLPLLLTVGVAACAPTEPAPLSERSQAKLDRALAGRSSGEPLTCVSSRDLDSSNTIGDGIIIFEGRSDTIFVNRPHGGCPGLQRGRSLVTRTSVDRLCRGDIATILDPVSGVEFGGCGLGDFVPYRRD